MVFDRSAITNTYGLQLEDRILNQGLVDGCLLSLAALENPTANTIRLTDVKEFVEGIESYKGTIDDAQYENEHEQTRLIQGWSFNILNYIFI